VRNTSVIIAIVVVGLVVLLLGGMGMMGFGPSGMMGRYGITAVGFRPFGMIISLVFWALIIGGGVLLIVWLAQGAGHSPSTGPAGGWPLDTLKLRYAKGEITKEQFEEMKRILGV
jgi:putative membrane protein